MKRPPRLALSTLIFATLLMGFGLQALLQANLQQATPPALEAQTNKQALQKLSARLTTSINADLQQLELRLRLLSTSLPHSPQMVPGDMQLDITSSSASGSNGFDLLFISHESAVEITYLQPSGVQLSEHDYQQLLAVNHGQWDLLAMEPPGRALLHISLPIMASNGSISSTLHGIVALERWQRLLDQQLEPDITALVLLSGSRILCHSESAEAAPLDELITWVGSQQAGAERSVSGTTQLSMREFRVTSLSTPLRLGAAQRSGITQTGLNSGQLLFISMLFSLLTGLFLLRITRPPLDTLSHYIEQLSSGHEQVRAPDSCLIEYSRLTAAVDGMAERLRANEQHLLGLIEATSVPIFIWNNQQEITQLNPAAEQLFGRSREEAIGLSVYQLFPVEITNDWYEAIARVSEGEKIIQLELPSPPQGVQATILAWSMAPLFADGEMLGAIAQGHDITRRVQIEESLRQVQASLENAQRMARIGNWSWDLPNHRVELSAQLRHIIGRLPERYDSSPEYLLRVVHQADRKRVRAAFEAALRGNSFEHSFRIVRPGGEVRYLHCWAEVVFDEHDRPVLMNGVVHDITAQTHTEERLRLWAEVLSSTAEGVLITDEHQHIIDVNTAFTTITGYSHDEVIGKHPSLLRSGHNSHHIYAELWHQLQTSDHWQGEIWNRRKDGTVYPQWLSVSTLRGESGEVSNYIAVFTDISSLKEREQRIQELAHFDTLTRLPNRALFEQQLGNAIQQATKQEQSLALLFIDIDRFKQINDSLGHHIGNQLLIQVAQRLSDCVSTSDSLAHLGGDEFTLILNPVSDQHEARVLAESVLASLERPYTIKGRSLHITVSIGISLYPEHGNNQEEILRGADSAMYHAKEQGHNSYEFFDSSMNERAEARLTLESELRQALDLREFTLVYQPRHDLSTGQLCGIEALLRWNHPRLGQLTPEHFLYAAEESGILLSLGEWVLRESLNRHVEWLAAGVPEVPITVNLSPRQFSHSRLMGLLDQLLVESTLPPHLLELELSEHLVMDDLERTIPILDKLQHRGIHLTIDGFGTGHSSLPHIKRLPFSSLKIDSRFVANIVDDHDNRAIVTAMVSLARDLNLTAIAVGVESQEQATLLRDMGCAQAQGYLYARPQDAQSLTQQLIPNTKERT